MYEYFLGLKFLADESWRIKFKPRKIIARYNKKMK